MMMEKFRSAFLAYPSEPAELVGPIEAAVEEINSKRHNITITKWPQLPIFGTFIPDQIREAILKSDVFVCDVTRPNLNVYYEIGFAIGSGKPVAPFINASFAGAIHDTQKDGFFDNIGYEQYENCQQIGGLFQNLPTTGLINLYGKLAW
jgi:hypothetical protein